MHLVYKGERVGEYTGGGIFRGQFLSKFSLKAIFKKSVYKLGLKIINFGIKRANLIRVIYIYFYIILSSLYLLLQYCNEVDWITMLWYKEGKKVQRGSVYK